jgi:hypothetical protein
MTGECRIESYVEGGGLGVIEEHFPIYPEWLRQKAYWIGLASRFRDRTVLVITLDIQCLKEVHTVPSSVVRPVAESPFLIATLR